MSQINSFDPCITISLPCRTASTTVPSLSHDSFRKWFVWIPPFAGLSLVCRPFPWYPSAKQQLTWKENKLCFWFQRIFRYWFGAVLSVQHRVMQRHTPMYWKALYSRKVCDGMQPFRDAWLPVDFSKISSSFFSSLFNLTENGLESGFSSGRPSFCNKLFFFWKNHGGRASLMGEWFRIYLYALQGRNERETPVNLTPCGLFFGLHSLVWILLKRS